MIVKALIVISFFYSDLKIATPMKSRDISHHTRRNRQVQTKDEIMEMQSVVRAVPVADAVKDYAIRLVLATHPGGEHATDLVNRYVRYGSSPRGAQSLVLAAKVLALIDGRYNADFEDIRRAALPGLRHRIILSFEGEAEGASTDDVVNDIVKRMPEA